ncbi:MAG: hypothetical protein ACYCVZ_16925 [Streptosporangiaceae bacterium]
MDSAQVEALRALLAPTGWIDRTRQFAGALRLRARTPQGLLIVGTPTDEPWHLTAHLADESRLAGLPELEPTLIRWAPPPGAPTHLRVGIDRLERAGRTETLLVVSPEVAPAALLERVADARKAGSTIFALDRGDAELDDLAHEALGVLSAQVPVSFDGAQHLVSAAVGESARAPGLRGAAVPRPRRADGLVPERADDHAAPDIGGYLPRADLDELLEAEAEGGDQARPGSRIAHLRGRLGRLLDAISGPQQDGWDRG